MCVFLPQEKNGGDTPPNSLVDLIASPNVKTTKGWRVQVCSLVCSTLGVEGRVRAPRLGLGRMTSESIIHQNLHKPNNKLVNPLLKHFWCMDEP
jgi:hypothetical protein